MARPVLFSTTTRADIDDPAVMIRDGSTTRAKTGAEERGVAGSVVCGFGAGCAGAVWGRRDEMWLLLEHAATKSASTMMNDLTSI